MKDKLFSMFFFLCLVLFTAVAVKGGSNPRSYQREKTTVLAGPFESSNNSARYALTESIVLRRSLFLDDELASFSSPDLSRINGRYLSIFTPGVAFLGIPFYLAGNIFGYPQVGAFLLSSLASIINVYLIAKILIRLQIDRRIGLLCGAIFLFATNAFSYSNSFNQHHLSTALMLISILISLSKPTAVKSILFGFVYSLGALIDIPNLFLLLPPLIAVLVNNIGLAGEKGNYFLKINLSLVGLVIATIPLLILFGWYNLSVTGSVFKLGQTSGRYIYSQNKIARVLNEVEKKEKRDFHQFDTRRLLTGFTVLLISRDRGLIWYSPVLLLGLLGVYFASRRMSLATRNILLTILLINIILYSLFNDPWGGWAFGPRYLIPSAAVLSIFLGVAVSEYPGRKILFSISLLLLTTYSVFVNTLGALTTQLVPSSVQLPFLSEKIYDYYKYNYTFLEKKMSSSLIYNTLFRNWLRLDTFVWTIATLILLFLTSLYIYILIEQRRGKMKTNTI